MRLAVRRELVVLRRVVVNPHRLRNSSYLMFNFIWRVMMKWWLQVVRGCWRHKLLKDDSDSAGVRNKNRVHWVQDLPSIYMVTYNWALPLALNIYYRIQAGVHVQPRICKLQRYNFLLHIILSVQQILCSVLSCILIKNEIRKCSAPWVVESFTHYLEITIKTLLICQIKHGKTA
jgi:hypothetical protein